MRLSPDQLIYWQHGFLKLNATIVFTWGMMLLLAAGSKLITRKLSTDLTRTRWQNLLEIVVTGIRKSVDESLTKKRASSEITEVVTAEDIGIIRNTIVPCKAAPAVPQGRPRRRNRKRCQ